MSDGSGGGVAWVRELRLVRLLALCVDALEGPAREICFAAHLHFPTLSDLQTERDASDGSNVLRHVLAHATVAARHAAHEHAVLVVSRNRESVNLQLGDVLEGAPVG